MRIGISSVAGPPRNLNTWSNAPSHMSDALELHGFDIVPIDSSCFNKLEKAALAVGNLKRGLPWNVVSWFEPARRKRSQFVAEAARRSRCDFVLCTGTLDAPVGEGINYAIWLDNTFALLKRSADAPSFNKVTIDEIERLEGLALRGAKAVLPFSQHVRDSLIEDYGIAPERAHAVGCGSGLVTAFEGNKDYSNGHLLFVAKHQFSQKGGDLVLEAFKLIRKRRPQTRLILIGNEEAKAKAAGIEGIECHGFIPREILNSYFHNAAMLVQPMLADPWGQVYLEAMKARAIIVSLNIAALPELTDNGRLGVLVEKPTPEEVATAVLKVYARPQDELNVMSREAQFRTLDRYSWQAVGERVAKVLQS